MVWIGWLLARWLPGWLTDCLEAGGQRGVELSFSHSYFHQLHPCLCSFSYSYFDCDGGIKLGFLWNIFFPSRINSNVKKAYHKFEFLFRYKKISTLFFITKYIAFVCLVHHSLSINDLTLAELKFPIALQFLQF